MMRFVARNGNIVRWRFKHLHIRVGYLVFSLNTFYFLAKRGRLSIQSFESFEARYINYKWFLRRSIRQDFCPPNITDITDKLIFDAADEALFCKILHHPNHLLAPLLPNKAYTPYHLRPRRHNRQRIPKINKLYDSNFIQRFLYKGKR